MTKFDLERVGMRRGRSKNQGKKLFWPYTERQDSNQMVGQLNFFKEKFRSQFHSHMRLSNSEGKNAVSD